ncbi:MAG: P27 family phage terminase small subunit [Cloacibacillus sp.]
MVTRGRKPKPAEPKELVGRSHHKKEAPPATLEIDAQPIEDYNYLPSPGELWDNLIKAGVVKMSDRLAFVRYHDLLTIYTDAARDVGERGQILNKGKSNERYNPSWRIMRDAQQELSRLEAEFALTPSLKRRVMQPVDAAVFEDGESEYEEMRKKQRKTRNCLRE